MQVVNHDGIFSSAAFVVFLERETNHVAPCGQIDFRAFPVADAAPGLHFCTVQGEDEHIALIGGGFVVKRELVVHLRGDSDKDIGRDIVANVGRAQAMAALGGAVFRDEPFLVARA